MSNQKNLVLKDWLLGKPLSSLYHHHYPRIFLLDGGASTHLESQGATFAYRELWSSSLLLTTPQLVEAGHGDWLRDGAVNLISTVTYQCHYQRDLWPSIIRDDAHMDTLWHKAVQLGRRAIEKQQQASNEQQQQQRYHGLVASSGCFGAALANGAEYTGDYKPYVQADIHEFHERKLQILRTLPVDAIAMETVPSGLECRVLRDILCASPSAAALDTGSTATTTPCWISLAFRNGHQLNDGSSVEEALIVLHEIPNDVLPALGFNCGHAYDLPSLLDHVIRFYRTRPSVPRRAIVFYPNAGESWDAATESWKTGTACADWVPTLMQCIRQLDDAWKKDSGGTTGASTTNTTLLALWWVGVVVQRQRI